MDGLFHGKPYQNGWFGGYPHFWKHPWFLNFLHHNTPWLQYDLENEWLPIPSCSWVHSSPLLHVWWHQHILSFLASHHHSEAADDDAIPWVASREKTLSACRIRVKTTKGKDVKTNSWLIVLNKFLVVLILNLLICSPRKLSVVPKCPTILQFLTSFHPCLPVQCSLVQQRFFILGCSCCRCYKDAQSTTSAFWWHNVVLGHQQVRSTIQQWFIGFLSRSKAFLLFHPSSWGKQGPGKCVQSLQNWFHFPGWRKSLPYHQVQKPAKLQVCVKCNHNC